MFMGGQCYFSSSWSPRRLPSLPSHPKSTMTGGGTADVDQQPIASDRQPNAADQQHNAAGQQPSATAEDDVIANAAGQQPSATAEDDVTAEVDDNAIADNHWIVVVEEEGSTEPPTDSPTPHANSPTPLRTTTSPLTTTLPPTPALSVAEASAADAMLPGLLPTPSRQRDDADLQPNATNAIAEDTATADDNAIADLQTIAIVEYNAASMALRRWRCHNAEEDKDIAAADDIAIATEDNAIGAEDNAIADQQDQQGPWWDNAIAERYLQDQQRPWWHQDYEIAWVATPRWQLQILNWWEQRQLWRCQRELQRQRQQERHRLEPSRRWWVDAAARTARAKANNISYERQVLLEDRERTSLEQQRQQIQQRRNDQLQTPWNWQ
jgi:hypothetical protein